MIATILCTGTPVTLLISVFVLVILAMAVMHGRHRPANIFSPADYGAKPLLTNWEAKAFLDIRTSLPAGYYA